MTHASVEAIQPQSDYTTPAYIDNHRPLAVHTHLHQLCMQLGCCGDTFTAEQSPLRCITCQMMQ
jgi:hypothetical protein